MVISAHSRCSDIAIVAPILIQLTGVYDFGASSRRPVGIKQVARISTQDQLPCRKRTLDILH